MRHAAVHRVNSRPDYKIVCTGCSLSAELTRLKSEASEREGEVHRLQLEAAGFREEASSSEQRAAAAATR